MDFTSAHLDVTITQFDLAHVTLVPLAKTDTLNETLSFSFIASHKTVLSHLCCPFSLTSMVPCVPTH